MVEALAVDIVEGVRARIALFGFEIREVSLEISLAALGKVIIVFGLIGTIAF